MRLLLFFLALAATASAQQSLIREVADTATDTHVEVTAVFTKLPPSGYFPIQVKIANNLPRGADVQLDFVSSVGYGDDGLKCVSSIRISAAGKKTVIRDILVPVCPTGGPFSDRAQLSIAMSGSLGRATTSFDSAGTATQPAVLLSETLHTPNSGALDSAATSAFGSPYSGSTDFAGKFIPQDLPVDWRAYSGFDAILMTDTDWTNSSPGSRNAIISWLHLGGQLVIHSQNPVTPAQLGLPEDASPGQIDYVHLDPAKPLALNPAKTIALVSAAGIPPKRASIQNDYQSAWPLQAHFGGQQFRYGLFIAVLVLFAILVGPVNLFVFAKSGRRHRLFITTPIISLAASLLLIVLIIVQDGFGGYGMRRVLMEVRPDEAAAYIHQEQFSRTGVLMGSKMQIDTPAVISPVPISSSRWARFTDSSAKGSYNIQPTDGGLSASGDWFQSRSEQGQIVTAVVSTRGRIERTTDPGQLLSAFDFPIDKLYYQDEKSQWHVATAIESGKRFTLAAIDTSLAMKMIKREASAFAARDRALLGSLQNRPGHFVALATKAPAIETLPGIRWKETKTVITGAVR